MLNFLSDLVQAFSAGFGFGATVTGALLQVAAFLIGLIFFGALLCLVYEIGKALHDYVCAVQYRAYIRHLSLNPTRDFAIDQFAEARQIVAEMMANEGRQPEYSAQAKALMAHLQEANQHLQQGRLRAAMQAILLLRAQASKVNEEPLVVLALVA